MLSFALASLLALSDPPLLVLLTITTSQAATCWNGGDHVFTAPAPAASLVPAGTLTATTWSAVATGFDGRLRPTFESPKLRGCTFGPNDAATLARCGCAYQSTMIYDLDGQTLPCVSPRPEAVTVCVRLWHIGHTVPPSDRVRHTEPI